MARYRYKPNGKKKLRRGNRRFFILAIVVIIAITIILKKCRRSEDEIFIPDDIKPTVKKVDVPTPKPLPKPKPKPLPMPNTLLKPETAKPVSSAKPTQPSDGSDPKARLLIEEAIGDTMAGQIISARDKFVQAMHMKLGPKMLITVKAQLAELSKRWLFSSDPYSGDTLTSVYEVQPGDLLSTIAYKHNVPYEILMAINGITDAKKLRYGDKIKVINGPFHAIVYRSTFTMDLYLGSKTYIKTYHVGLGQPGKDTPTGKWRVKIDGKLIEPPWPRPEGGLVYAGDPEYPLGSRWIGVDGIAGNAKGRTGFGVHGTKDPESIGKRSSLGCIRLHNGHVKEFYSLVMPGVSEIRIVD